MKKIILITTLIMFVFSCSLFDVDEWKEAHQRSVERGRTCYESANGNIYCKDTK